MDRIRVGMIDCDLHTFYYAALMSRDYDPIALRDSPSKHLGQAAFFYHYLHYNDPRRITAPVVDSFIITRFWDRRRDQAEEARAVFNRDGRVCDSFAEVCEDVDLVFIPDCNGDGSDHLELARPSLEKGVPTFIDKPLAYEYRDAKALVDLARCHGTPMMSLSMLREVPHAARFRSRFAELGEPEFGTVKGGGTAMAGHIHAISLAQHLFGPGVETVSCMGKAELAHVLLEYGGKPGRPKSGVVLNCDVGGTYHCSFYASAYSSLGAIHSPQIGDFEFPEGAAAVLRKIEAMVRTRQPQAPYEEMLECIAIATAGRLAQKEGRAVGLGEVTGSGGYLG